ncbi:hypothetical protein BED46_040025 [Burkholderia contaminans]|uniref:Uncharacterized protein n=1 Tax=Burkholderia contaminans LMG 23361 TaxID=1334628 RepID=A0ABD4AU39_9BURK|nr:hypothetical protein WR31_17315 [Burkholderia contaminans LMG 23361]MBA9828433.1 hypothetical protein [Burkholderia contaminans]MBA9836981.1 hypothetical protein [Burkholderia contaminans]MBA9863366.1 hypothetical protein [Burkholderia contaminans]MBA9904121.1 hypothetical protein [Burkholderia contaminans]
MQAGAAGGGREEACILPAGERGRRRGERPGAPPRTGAGAVSARGSGRRPRATGIVPRRW